MTAGEFAKKYGIDYQIVRAASFRTATRQSSSWALDYGEPELKKAVREEMEKDGIEFEAALTKIAGEITKLDGKAVGA